MKQKIEVEVDVPEGYELTGESTQADLNNGWIGVDIKLRKKFEWPEWLKAEWIAMDENGVWSAFVKEKPEPQSTGYWGSGCGGVCLTSDLFDYSLLPKVETKDWKQSLIRNPHL